MAIKGGDTSALRIYNERLILSSIRRYGPQSKAELGRLTSLSSQAASDIAKRLLADGLII
ncbi:MAG: MarR family transcriptional regulator, partial [Mangrovicoccus sp.]